MDVCRALEAAHAQGVIHRDIKPGNIMLNPRGEVKVTDFGIARVTTTADTVAQTAAILGTASYLSPEQAQGQPVDGRSDIYSLGCVLYEMVTGRPPFLGDSPVAVASKQVLEQPTPPSRLNSDVTADLDAVILRALAKNPANRYQSAEEMRADLERAKRGLPVQATPLLAAGTTQVLDRPPAQATEVLPPPEPDRRNELGADRRDARADRAPGGPVVVPGVNVLNNDDQQTGVLVTVPNVVGDKRAQAISEIEDAGLEVGTITPSRRRRHAGARNGRRAGPAAGDEVDRGTAVDLTIVESPDQVAIPDLEGSSVEEAEAALLELGLEPAGPVEEPSDTVDEGSVTRTDPARAGGRAGIDGDDLRLDRAEQVAVPEVRCRSFGSAQNELSKVGLNSVISSDTVEVNPACPLATRWPRAGSRPRDPGRPRDDRDPVPGRGRADRSDRRHRRDRRVGVAAWFVHEEFTAEERARLDRTSRTSTVRSSRSRTCPRWSRARCSRATRGRRSRPPVPRRVRRAARGRRRRRARGRQGREGRAAVRSRLLRVRRRLRRAARWRAPRVRAGLAAPREGDRMGAPRGLPRAVDALHALRRPARRPVAAHDAARDRGWPRRRAYEAYATRTFEAYGRMFQPLFDLFAERFPRTRRLGFPLPLDDHREDLRHPPGAPAGRDALEPRGVRDRPGLRADADPDARPPLAEVREYADLMLVELRKVIPAFLKRVDLPDRGVAWSRYLAETREATAEVTAKFTEGAEPGHREPSRSRTTTRSARRR